ncbi:ribosome small subunit-dependent GTPase A [Lacticaseibacillus porcinae]|uniref:ribosome small subunit-dependent GTPase A n=1 Tax=Lacticaseibacillus porcinae TaxID=1123687 RepID=UPI000F7851A7|nr:ribosome small subunit-dependent GTPase A [Lacticaseibacillus porcinae]
MNLSEYGNTESQVVTAGLNLGRVITVSHQTFTVVTEFGRFHAEISGRLRNLAMTAEDLPTVGDWVQLRLPANREDVAYIERLNERHSVFLRKTAGRQIDAQLVAANIDWLLLCMALDHNFNVRRLERYLAVAAASGAKPSVVLTKADQARDLSAQLAEVDAVLPPQTPVIICDATRADGLAELANFMQPRQTYALIGSSGVGKTTLINHLSHQVVGETQAVRASDSHGRHTTTTRQLMVLPNQSIVIDTPGMRELGLMDADVAATFDDIVQLAQHCRFSDCTHQQEPGCAVQAAIATGEVDATRLRSYQELQQEASVNTQLRGKAREQAKIKRMFGSKKQMQAVRKASRHHQKY